MAYEGKSVRDAKTTYLMRELDISYEEAEKRIIAEEEEEKARREGNYLDIMQPDVRGRKGKVGPGPNCYGYMF